MKKIAYFLIIMLILAGCNQEKELTSSSNKLDITVSSYPLQYIFEQIGGDFVSVESILPPGTDAHTYEPTAKTIVKISESDLFVYTGAVMEPYAQSIAESLKEENVHLVSIDQIEAVFHQINEKTEAGDEHGHDHNHEHAHGNDGHHHGDVDPHFWLDPLRMITAGDFAKTELSHLLPEYTEIFNENFQRFKENMQALDNQFKRIMEDKDNKTIFVSHAAFGYWEELYGIEQLSIRGLSTANEPSQKELKDLVDQVQKEKIPYVILEQNQHDQIAELLAKELNLDILYIHNLSSLTDQEIASGFDYVSIMKKNIETIDQALRR
jgi:zinc transport system substrate-binding protein